MILLKPGNGFPGAIKNGPGAIKDASGAIKDASGDIRNKAYMLIVAILMTNMLWRLRRSCGARAVIAPILQSEEELRKNTCATRASCGKIGDD